MNQIPARIEPNAPSVRDQSTAPFKAEALPRLTTHLESARELVKFAMSDRHRAKTVRRLAMAVFVLVPTLLTALYCYVIAAPMYVSEVRFFIGGASDSGGAGAVSKIPGLGGGAAPPMVDGFAVRDYLASYEALETLDKNAKFTERLSRPKGDLFNHLSAGATKETRLNFFRNVVRSRYDLTEGIVTVQVFAFVPEDSFAIASEIMQMAEGFSNEMNRRVTEGMLRVAEGEVERAKERFAEARIALNEWRKANANFNPEANAKMIGEIIGQLEAKYVETRMAIEEIQRNTRQSPQVAALTERLATLQGQIESERKRLIAPDQSSSVVNQLDEYQRLSLTQEFVAKGFESALQSLQSTRALAGYKQKYVLAIVSPTRPQDAAYPTPFKTISMVFVGALIIYGLLSLLFATIRDSHQT
jgi:capsular polysaccharide transport system permease protein